MSFYGVRRLLLMDYHIVKLVLICEIKRALFPEENQETEKFRDTVNAVLATRHKAGSGQGTYRVVT